MEEDKRILDKESSVSDLLLEYKRGKRTRKQVDGFILKVMGKAREEERLKAINR